MNETSAQIFHMHILSYMLRTHKESVFRGVYAGTETMTIDLEKLFRQ